MEKVESCHRAGIDRIISGRSIPSNPSQSITIHPNLSESIRIQSNLSESIPIHPFNQPISSFKSSQSIPIHPLHFKIWLKKNFIFEFDLGKSESSFKDLLTKQLQLIGFFCFFLRFEQKSKVSYAYQRIYLRPTPHKFQYFQTF